MKFLDRIPLWMLIILALGLGVAPLGSQPHLVEKLTMLMNGTLVKPIDIFDLFLHGIFPVLLLLKIIRQLIIKKASRQEY